MTRPCIPGIDFLRKHNIFAGWTAEGKFKLISQQEFLVESLEVLMDGPMIYNKQGITVTGRRLAVIKVSIERRLAVIKVSIEMDETMDGQMFEVKPNFLLTNEHPNLSRLYAAIPTAREIRICKSTEGYLCLMNQALYPIEKLEWCAYALFAQDQNKIRQYCAINTQKWDANRALKFGWIPLGSVFIEERENAGQMFARHSRSGHQATTDHHICGQWL